MGRLVMEVTELLSHGYGPGYNGTLRRPRKQLSWLWVFFYRVGNECVPVSLELKVEARKGQVA